MRQLRSNLPRRRATLRAKCKTRQSGLAHLRSSSRRLPPASHPRAHCRRRDRQENGVNGEDAEHAATLLGRALAAFRRLQVDLAKERETRDDIAAVRRRVQRLEESAHPLVLRARALLQHIEERATLVGERRSPTIRGLNIKKLRFDGVSVGAALIDDVLLGEPLLSAGEVLAQMQARALRNRLAPPLVDGFRWACLESSGETDEALRIFERLALLRYACRRARTHADDQTIAPLLGALRLA